MSSGEDLLKRLVNIAFMVNFNICNICNIVGLGVASAVLRLLFPIVYHRFLIVSSWSARVLRWETTLPILRPSYPGEKSEGVSHTFVFIE